ncbi:hypothetical protein ONS95_003390 [Cadophora gregata]|uniref:uncharacterized protein n=1 Tax=Cadophora gregata TaxID=51156 RepID=UPI0026DDA960|nr:uncharacterized protein ONS95_003390 [Cadophora gregata]KAK0108593.1 hypothetical protein ONS95_003390 [Cadophora gregata]KAK0108814.1 hypothetical protein ONS96_002656 [Cadophora gregata f. sp. sojae]
MALENFDIERSNQEMIRQTLISSMSFWLTIARLLQISLSFTVLFCTGYTANIFLGDWFHTFGLSFVTFVVTMLFMFYIFVTPRRFPKVYQYRVHIAMEIFVTCHWIATVALLSWECQTWDAAEDVVSDVLSYEPSDTVHSLPHQDSGIRSLRAATALASINCVLWAITLFILRRVLLYSEDS